MIEIAPRMPDNVLTGYATDEYIRDYEYDPVFAASEGAAGSTREPMNSAFTQSPSRGQARIRPDYSELNYGIIQSTRR